MQHMVTQALGLLIVGAAPYLGFAVVIDRPSVALVRQRSRGSTVGGGSTVSVGAGSHGHSGVMAGTGAGSANKGTSNSSVHVSLEVLLESEIMKLIKGQGPTVHKVSNMVNGKMNLDDAVNRLNGKLPDDVTGLLHKSRAVEGKTQKGEFDEDSLAKARNILNGMVEGSVKELDAVILECKEFEERNRGTYGQVTTDLARLGSQIADLSRKRVEANEGIQRMDADRASIEGELQKETNDFTSQRLANEAELTIRMNDLAVFNFILEMVRCGEGDFFLQTNTGDNVTKSFPQVCAVSDSDDLEIRFDNPKVQAKWERMMTPSARKALREALGEVNIGKAGLLQKGGARRHHRRQDPDAGSEEAEAPVTTTTGLPTMTVPPAPVAKEPAAEGQWKKCTDGKPNCGLLHDTMSLQWGKFKDEVDSLKHTMAKNQDAFDELKENLDSQLTVIGDAKTKFMELLAETISGINADTEEMAAKDAQGRELTKEYKKKMSECKAKVEEILFTNICAVRKVRNSIMTHSEVSPPAKISDCDVADWIAAECSVDCDDACPMDDPYACGGWQTLTREVVVAPNEYGLKCPALTTQKKCNQFKCPVDCVLSEWSGWSKCTKECEGGVQQETRSILTKAKNGGEMCDTVAQEQSCNTGSCDRDCTLTPWTDWSPCSMACGGGMQEHVRNVVIPIRGGGKCPKPKNADRLQERPCNVQDCVGDEVCIATQDLIMAVDGSGSLKESGFDVVRSFAMNVTGRYKGEYYGKAAAQLGVLEFGNGQVMPDGTIAPAINVLGLTADMEAVSASIEALTWQRGLTNMAQAFTLADTMLAQGGRPEATSAVLVFSDGMYSFEFMTAQAVQKLKDKNVMIFMAPIASGKSDYLKTLKSWASQPWQTNYERIPGLLALEHNLDMFAQKVVSKFCPASFSPSAEAAKEVSQQFMLIHENGEPSPECATMTGLGIMASIDECAAATREAGYLAFAFGKGPFEANKCKAANIESTESLWNELSADRTNPPCPGGEFTPNPYFDVFLCKPMEQAAEPEA